MWQVIERSGAVQIFQKSLHLGQLPNAYLLVGPAHVGKMALAINLAQALNCTCEERPCGECSSCQKIERGKHADVQIVALDNRNAKELKAKEISIEQIREIQRYSSLPPFEGKFKVFIIDGVELLSNEAANCLLKTLEEPAEKVIYLLLTVNDKLLPSTVVSRCQRIRLFPVPASSIEKYIIEKNKTEPEKARLVSHLARGCPGWAISAARDDNILNERSEKIDRLLKVVDASIEERFNYVNQLITASRTESGKQLIQDTLNFWLDWWHDLILVKSGSAEMINNIDLMTKLSEIAGGYDLKQIRDFISKIQNALIQLKLNASPRLVLEVLMLNIPGRVK
jgi:DNA polymerase III subunit delta'